MLGCNRALCFSFHRGSWGTLNSSLDQLSMGNTACTLSWSGAESVKELCQMLQLRKSKYKINAWVLLWWRPKSCFMLSIWKFWLSLVHHLFVFARQTLERIYCSWCKDWVHKNSSEICDRLVRPKIFCLTGVRALSDLSKGALVFPSHLANTRLRL